MKIIIVSYAYHSKCSPRAFRCSALAEFWSSKGFTVDVITYDDGTALTIEQKENLRIFRVSSPISYCWFFPAKRKLVQLLNENHYDVLISVGLPFISHLVCYSVIQRYPQIFWMVDNDDPFSFMENIDYNNRKLHAKPNSRNEKAVFKKCHGLLFTSKEATDLYAKHFDMPEIYAKSKVIPLLLSNQNLGLQSIEFSTDKCKPYSLETIALQYETFLENKIPAIESKVCMLLWSDLKYDARVQKEALTLTQGNNDVTILSLAAKSRLATLENVKLSYYKLPFSSLLNRIRYPSLRFFCKLIAYFFAYLQIIIKASVPKYDIYHAHDIFALPALWVAAKIRRKKLVYDAHELTIEQAGVIGHKARIFKFLEKKLCPSADAMITTTEMRAQLFSEYYKIAQPMVLQNRPLYKEIAPKNLLRQKLKFSEHDFIVLYQGAFQIGRGLRNLVEVAKTMPYIQFVLIGYGELEDILKSSCKNYPNIHFHKAILNHKLLDYTADADVGMQVLRNTCLNHYTTDSNKLFEYIMAGVPVIASDFPEIRHIVDSHQVGLLVDPDDLEQIRAAINTLYINKELRLEFKRNTLAATKILSWEEQAGKLVDLYTQLAEKV